MLKKIKKNYFLLVSTFLIIYFFFNLLSGQRGLISYFDKKQHLKELQMEETLIRERLLFGKKDEKIYLIKKNDTEN